MADYVWQTEWTGKFTRWKYMLKIAPPTLSGRNGSLIRLPHGCVVLRKISAQYDKFPIGMSVSIMELDVFIKDIEGYPLDHPYSVFQRYLICPIEYGEILNEAGGYIYRPMNIELYIDFQHDDEEPQYRYVGTWCHFDNLGYSYDLEEKKITIRAKDIFYTILSQLRAEHLWWETRNYLRSANMIIEAKIRGLPCISLPEFESKLISHSDFQTCFNTIYQRGGNIVNSVGVNPILLPAGSFFRQLEDDSGGLGSQLEINELYYLHTILRDNQAVGGVLEPVDDVSIQRTYNNSLWDFLSDWAVSFYQKWLPNLGIFAKIYGYVGAETIVYLDISHQKFSKIELKIYNESGLGIKTATASLHESLSQDNISDIDNYRATIPGTRNEGEWTIPIYFNNIPVCVKYRPNDVGNGWIAYRPHRLGIYYFPDTEPTHATKVHPWCFLSLGGGKTTADYVPFSPIPPDPQYDTVYQYFAVIQQKQGLPAITAKTALEIFGKNTPIRLTGSVRYNEFTHFSLGGGIGWPWWQFDTKFVLPVANILPFMPEQRQDWYLVSSTLDFINEMCDFELFLK